MGKAADGAPNYQNSGYCIAIKGGTAKQNVELVMSECQNGTGQAYGNTG